MANYNLWSKVHSVKDGGKGNLSVYGLGKFPVTLYDPQWRALLAMATGIVAQLDEAKAAGDLSEAKPVTKSATGRVNLAAYMAEKDAAGEAR